MRRFTPTHVVLAIITAAFTVGWTTEETPKGDTTTIARGDVIYADDGSAIRIYRAGEDGYDLIMSIETDPLSATHEDYDHRRKRRHSFSCSCSIHDHGDRHHDRDYQESTASFVATDNTLLYVYDHTQLVAMDISRPDAPTERSRADVGWDIESVEVVEGTVIVKGDQGIYTLDAARPMESLRDIIGD